MDGSGFYADVRAMRMAAHLRRADIDAAVREAFMTLYPLKWPGMVRDACSQGLTAVELEAIRAVWRLNHAAAERT